MKIFVLPFGWCCHVFWDGDFDSFLVRCSETGLFSGIDLQIKKFRIVLMRVNHLDDSDLIEMVEKTEKAVGV